MYLDRKVVLPQSIPRGPRNVHVHLSVIRAATSPCHWASLERRHLPAVHRRYRWPSSLSAKIRKACELATIDLNKSVDLTGLMIIRVEARLPVRVILDVVDPKSIVSEHLDLGEVIFFGARIEHFSFRTKDIIGEIKSFSISHFNGPAGLKNLAQFEFEEGRMEVSFNEGLYHTSSATIVREEQT